MDNNINKEEVVETTPWMLYVTNEVLALLKIFLPVAISGNVGLKYKNPVVESYETHTVLDKTKAEAVAFTVVLEFEKPIDIPEQVEFDK